MNHLCLHRKLGQISLPLSVQQCLPVGLRRWRQWEFKMRPANHNTYAYWKRIFRADQDSQVLAEMKFWFGGKITPNNKVASFLSHWSEGTQMKYCSAHEHVAGPNTSCHVIYMHFALKEDSCCTFLLFSFPQFKPWDTMCLIWKQNYMLGNEYEIFQIHKSIVTSYTSVFCSIKYKLHNIKSYVRDRMLFIMRGHWRIFERSEIKGSLNQNIFFLDPPQVIGNKKVYPPRPNV